MRSRLFTAMAWALLGFVAFATLSPIQQRPELASSVHLEHVAAFAVLGMVFVAAYPRRLGLVCSLVLGSAVILEFLQTLTPDRHGRLIDASEKVIGGLVGIYLARAAVGALRRWTSSSEA